MPASRTTPQRIVGAIGRLPLVSNVVRFAPVRGLLEKMAWAQDLYSTGWERTHPFDRAHGTDTSGVVPATDLPLAEAARIHAVCYAGSQPSLLRLALASLPAVSACTFVDLGCGKGRALLVASEFPFKDIVGVELSAPLAAIAVRNAALIRRRFPERSAVRVVVADASAFPLPAGDLVIFMYHPFGPELVARVAASVASALAAGDRCVYIVYYNPVAGDCFDATPGLRRRFARTLPYAAEELGYGPDDTDTVVIWQGGSVPPSTDPAGDRIVLAAGGLRAELQP